MFIVAIALYLVNIVCLIMVLIKMFSEGVVKGLLGFICGLYAFIWGWQNVDEVGSGVMTAWTGAIIGSIVLNFVSR